MTGAVFDVLDEHASVLDGASCGPGLSISR